MRRFAALRLLAIGSGLWVPALAQAQAQTSQPTPRVYLITVGQGAELWEKFGHNALWFYDDATGVDEAYNWGVFDFNQPRFVQRFLSGDTRYWVEKYPGQLLIDYYKRSDRTVVVQRLNLAPDQARKALAYSRWNAREENKYYRYDYFRDNCSTRVRDVINLAVGGSLKRTFWEIASPVSYKQESVRLMDDLKLTQMGMYAALGRPADQRMSLWHLMFIPMRLRDLVRSEEIVGPMGAPVKLVAEERTLYTSKAHHERATVPALWIPYLLVGLVLAAEFLAVGWGRSRSRLAERVYRAEVIMWSVITGLSGVVILCAWLFTRHIFWFRNENLLLVNPLALWLAAVTILAITRERFTRQATILAGIVAGSALAALVLWAMPGMRQDNLPLILLFLPPQLAIAAGFWRAAPSPSPRAHAVVDRR